jgi:rhodanese-related sulfurtransferase
VARILNSEGFENVWVLKGGWRAWKDAGFPVAPK